MRELIRRIGNMPLLRRTVDSIDPDRTVILLFRCNLENAVAYYGGKYRNLPEFRLLDWAENDPACPENTEPSVASALKRHEFMHKEWCVYAPQSAEPFETPDGNYHGSWAHTIRAAHSLGLESLLCEKDSMRLFWGIDRCWLPSVYFAEQIHFFSKIYNLFTDEESKRVFAAVVRARLTGETGYLPLSPYLQYYHPRVRPQCGDTVCDAGGGDTLEHMTSTGFAQAVGPQGKVFCFEPIAENYAELQKHAASHPNIMLEHRGVWSGPAVLPMLYSRDSSSVDRWGTHETKTQTCSFIDIDTYFSMKHERCDFLKMDIEGAELEALRGAEQTLRRYRPKLAISVYHSPLKDFLHIPKFISELGLEYEFFLGHHTPYWYETILYCKPCS